MKKIWDEFDYVFEDAHPEEKAFFHAILIEMEGMTKNIIAIQRALDLMCKSVELARSEISGESDV